MKCYFCGKETDILLDDNDYINKYVCEQCITDKNLFICTRSGKVIDKSNFSCDKICNDCVYMEDNKE